MDISANAGFSNTTTKALVVTGLVAAAVYFLFRRRSPLRKIPGPKGIPIFGNAVQLKSERPHLTISEWATEFGDLMKINLFGEDVIVVNALDAITDMLVSKSTDFAGRPFFFRQNFQNGNGTVSFGDFSPEWSTTKKLAMKGLKQVGDQLTELEGIMSDIMEISMTKLATYTNYSVDLKRDIEHFVYNITVALVYGHKLTEDERHEFAQIIVDTNERMSPKSDDAILDIVPLSRGPWYSKFREWQELSARSKAFRDSLFVLTIEKHQENEFLGALGSLMNDIKNEPSSDQDSKVSMENVKCAAMDLASAGVITTTSVLYYFIALMACYPKIQDEVHQATIDAIGHRRPTLKDRFSIPYIESMIFEILRLMSHVPFGLPHKTTTDTSLLGYDIPKGTQVWFNSWHLHHDENLWDEPWEFKPKRFLDNDSKLITPDHPLRKQLFIFGAGRRGCAGEMLARNRMFLYMVTMLQRFKIIQPEGETIKCDPRDFRTGIVLYIENFKVQLEPRN